MCVRLHSAHRLHDTQIWRAVSILSTNARLTHRRKPHRNEANWQYVCTFVLCLSSHQHTHTHRAQQQQIGESSYEREQNDNDQIHKNRCLYVCVTGYALSLFATSNNERTSQQKRRKENKFRKKRMHYHEWRIRRTCFFPSKEFTQFTHDISYGGFVSILLYLWSTLNYFLNFFLKHTLSK